MKPNKLNPARVRRGFRNLRPALPCPARAPKPSRPGPGRPLGSKNHQRDTRYDVGKIVRRPETIIDGTGSDHKEQLRTSASAPTVRGEINLARESTQGPAEQGFLQAEPTSAPDAPAFVLSVLFLRAAPLFLPGRLLLLHGFFQGAFIKCLLTRIPAASWWARTVLESTLISDKSVLPTRAPSAIKPSSRAVNTPASRHTQKRP